jgi:hypothetical protein
MEWINVKYKKPEILAKGYSEEVLVCRPNKYSGKTDILTALYHQAKPEGQEYGRGNSMGGYQKTYKPYWSVPAILLEDSVTYWMPLPKPPCEGKDSKTRESNCNIPLVVCSALDDETARKMLAHCPYEKSGWCNTELECRFKLKNCDAKGNGCELAL